MGGHEWSSRNACNANNTTTATTTSDPHPMTTTVLTMYLGRLLS